MSKINGFGNRSGAGKDSDFSNEMLLSTDTAEIADIASSNDQHFVRRQIQTSNPNNFN